MKSYDGNVQSNSARMPGLDNKISTSKTAPEKERKRKKEKKCSRHFGRGVFWLTVRSDVSRRHMYSKHLKCHHYYRSDFHLPRHLLLSADTQYAQFLFPKISTKKKSSKNAHLFILNLIYFNQVQNILKIILKSSTLGNSLISDGAIKQHRTNRACTEADTSAGRHAPLLQYIARIVVQHHRFLFLYGAPLA